jgi:hypothetical protein
MDARENGGRDRSEGHACARTTARIGADRRHRCTDRAAQLRSLRGARMSLVVVVVSLDAKVLGLEDTGGLLLLTVPLLVALLAVALSALGAVAIALLGGVLTDPPAVALSAGVEVPATAFGALLRPAVALSDWIVVDAVDGALSDALTSRLLFAQPTPPTTMRVAAAMSVSRLLVEFMSIAPCG